MSDTPSGAIVAKTIAIRAIRLVQCALGLNTSYDFSADRSLQVPLVFGLSRDFSSPTSLAVTFGVTVFEAEADADVDVPFHARVFYEGRFEVEADAAEGLKAFAKYNAASMLIPYVREMLSSLTVRAGMAPLLIPPVDIKMVVDQIEAAAKAAAPAAG